MQGGLRRWSRGVEFRAGYVGSPLGFLSLLSPTATLLPYLARGLDRYPLHPLGSLLLRTVLLSPPQSCADRKFISRIIFTRREPERLG